MGVRFPLGAKLGVFFLSAALISIFAGRARPQEQQASASGSDAAFERQINEVQVSADSLAAARKLKKSQAAAHLAPAGYDAFVFSAVISKSALAQALQEITTAAYGVGFRTLGDPDDLFHGHFVFDGTNAKPRFILFHAQERANLYRLYDPGSRYDYVDKSKRNWIVWLDSGKAEDARPYRYDWTKPDWCGEDEFFTILPGMLDPKKLGFTPVTIPEYYQFDFYKTKCDGSENSAGSAVVSVLMPGGEKQCLEFSTDPSKAYSRNFFKFARELGADQKKGKNLDACPAN